MKFQNGQECGGAYVKLLTKDTMPVLVRTLASTFDNIYAPEHSLLKTEYSNSKTSGYFDHGWVKVPGLLI